MFKYFNLYQTHWKICLKSLNIFWAIQVSTRCSKSDDLVSTSQRKHPSITSAATLYSVVLSVGYRRARVSGCPWTRSWSWWTGKWWVPRTPRGTPSWLTAGSSCPSVSLNSLLLGLILRMHGAWPLTLLNNGSVHFKCINAGFLIIQ